MRAPDLSTSETVHGSRPGDVFVRRGRLCSFRRTRGVLVPLPEAAEPRAGLGRALHLTRRFLFGAPLASHQESEERTGKIKGLAIFASDNISSSAYATEEIMRVLVLAGAAALSLTIPITVAIVVTSYPQVIRAHPGGGGSYNVARENLGPLASLTAAALLTDYVLTVAVSVSAGVAAMTSAFPFIFEDKVAVAVAIVVVMTVMNLRGRRESGNVFALPTYFYLVCILGVIAFGFYLTGTNGSPEFSPPADWLTAYGAEPLTLLLILRAFASGSVALTGTEAVSNGVPAFKPPEVRNAQITLIAMGALFATIFFGISFLSGQLGIVPDPHEVETVTSQLTRLLIGTGPLYFAVQVATALILVLAANTAFNGFPLLASILARDRFLS